MLSVEDAQALVLATVSPLPVQQRPLLETLDCVLAADMFAGIDLPPFANSSMDGYALRAMDTVDAMPDRPRRLPVAGEVAAGDPGTTAVPPGFAVRIMTGAPLPPGADAVVPIEQTRSGNGFVELLAPEPEGSNIRAAGGDVRRGQIALTAGTPLGPGELGLLAALGYAIVPVHARPVVAILSTGNELIDVTEQPGPGQIRNSNATMLAAQILRAGATPRLLPVARDTRAEVEAALAGALDADLIVSSGGVSVGDYDVVRQVLEAQGDLSFWRVRMRPGKPIAFGHLGGTPILGLPGNPVASFVTFEIFARPLIRKMAGQRAIFRQVVRVRVDEVVPSAGERRHYVRAVARWQDGGWRAVTTGAQASHLLRSTVAANALIVVPEGAPDLEAGSLADALLLDWPEWS